MDQRPSWSLTLTLSGLAAIIVVVLYNIYAAAPV